MDLPYKLPIEFTIILPENAAITIIIAIIIKARVCDLSIDVENCHLLSF